MSDIAISVANLSKQYHIGGTQNRYRTFRESLTGAVTAPVRRTSRLLSRQVAGTSQVNDKIWALKDISFEVKWGEVVGVIGRNGAGKSTLLKILSRITEPTHGYADIYGRVGALLEVGTGFHPELTGKENIYLNGAILGMPRAEIEKKFDEIVAFAEVEKFINTPVKHYSSGMGLRLGFAVAAHLEPEILVVDEVLAVGDAAFQKKCLGKMGEVAREGRTVLFVSHNMAAVSALCSKGLLLNNGQVVYIGNVVDVISKYMDMGAVKAKIPLKERTDRRGNGRIRFTDVTFLDENNNTVSSATSGKPFSVVLSYSEANGQKARDVDAFIAFHGSFGELLFVCHVRLGRGTFDELPPDGQLICHIPKFPLTPGRYRFSIEIGIAPAFLMDSIDDAGSLFVEPGDFYGTGNLPMRQHQSAVMVEHDWHVLPQGQTLPTSNREREETGVIEG
jgi:lipopolysaccharide transport system ATP-binding protein